MIDPSDLPISNSEWLIGTYMGLTNQQIPMWFIFLGLCVVGILGLCCDFFRIYAGEMGVRGRWKGVVLGGMLFFFEEMVRRRSAVGAVEYERLIQLTSEQGVV